MLRKPKRRGRTQYLHLLDGRPARYYPGEQIYLMRPGERFVFCTSLRQLYREQQASTRWRLQQGYPSLQEAYDHLRVIN